MPELHLTTPIYSVNGDPHIGNAHTGIMAGILKRAAQMRGIDVFLTTGTDEHGQKNEEAAERSGLQVDAYLEVSRTILGRSSTASRLRTTCSCERRARVTWMGCAFLSRCCMTATCS